MDTIAPKNAAEQTSIDTGALKKVAQEARRVLRDQVTAKLALVLAEASAARRETPKTVKELEGAIEDTSRDQIVERVAYTWFNRFTALRFMDANGYTAVHAVTPAIGQTRPEILSEAMAGIISDEVPEAAAAQVRALLDNRTPSHDPQGEAYRLLLVATCNHWHAAMPFMFETIADYTELLMPEDLLSQGSILSKLRAAMTQDACQDVEIIGWLYQFYISEKKDEVFAGLKKNKKITPENIPAATQLFTPHWIVRYLVENSLGRLWMLNHPNSKLKDRMDYYIAAEQPEEDFLRVQSPEEIKICDPACGSGHMLTYAFDLLHAIYEEEGYDAADIPSLILTYNLYGIEIDERAGELAAFALTMKAAARRKRFVRRGVQPNVCVLESVKFEPGEINDYMEVVGRDLFTAPLRETLKQFEEADNFGSLIRPALTDHAGLRQMIDRKDVGGNLFLRDIHARVQRVLRMAEFLAPKYHIVIANPPYMGSKGMNARLANWTKQGYPDSRSDLFSMFIERAVDLSIARGLVAMVAMQTWMFLSTYKVLREKLLTNTAISNLIQIGYNSFPEMNSKVALAAAWVLKKLRSSAPGIYINLNDTSQSADKNAVFFHKLAIKDFYLASPEEFRSIPGSPIAYWVSSRVRAIFSECTEIGGIAEARQGLITADNERFVRQWHEVEAANSCFNATSRETAAASGKTWFPFNKGGEFRRWYGNHEFIVNWKNDGEEIKNLIDDDGNVLSRPQNMPNYFRESVSWSDVTTGATSFRFYPSGFINDATGHSAFGGERPWKMSEISYLNTKFVGLCTKILNPTIHFHVGYFNLLPYAVLFWSDRTKSIADRLIAISKSDWDASENSWNFTTFPLLATGRRSSKFAECYAHLLAGWKELTEEMQSLEEESNRIFIGAYGLQQEVSPEVPRDDITLTCNPAYRYGGNKSVVELETLLVADTVAEFVSYAVGCMFGRYSLDVPGLILANQGEALEHYLAKVPNPTFEPDADNVIPVLEGDWFADDVAARFRKFLRVTFGDEHFQENLAFIEEALGKEIRKYFMRDFFNDHVRRYKKRPIYWLFSSPRGTFNALIYMHRYRPDTVSVVLNEYLREFRSKLEAHRRTQQALSISGEASPSQRTKALKEIEAAGKQIEELDAWERDVLFPLASQKVEIDLDDGVKANYPKLGAALKPIKGLNDAGD